MYWSWILETVSFTGLFLVGKKFWWAWLILIANTVLWAIYGVLSKQYGFCVASCFYAPMYVKNLWQWFRTRHENPSNSLSETEKSRLSALTER